MCSTRWETLEDFISDPDLVINGYLADFERLEWSLFYFTHMKPDCRSTLAVEAKSFFSLYHGKRHSERRTGKEDCPGYCLDKNELGRCDAFCECAFNREIIQIIKERQGRNASAE